LTFDVLLNGSLVSTSDFLDSHFPDRKVSTPVTTEKFSTNIPSLQPPTNADLLDRGEFEDYSVEIHEWLALFLLQSPRISKDDKIDLLLSRYSIPSGSIMTANLVKVTWQGFLSPMWAHKTFVQLILAVPQDRWFAYAVDGFSEGWRNECRSSTILKIPDVPNEYMLWDIA
jgi:ribonuclease P/MRP protein subunit RPP40